MPICLYGFPNVPTIRNEGAYIEFIEKTMNAHSRNCWKYNKNECCFSCEQYFTQKTIIAKPLDSEFTSNEKQDVKKQEILD